MMLNNIDIDPVCYNNDDAKRNQLIDMIINHKKREQKQVNNRVEELRSDPCVKLAGSCPYNKDNALTLTTDSSCDIKIWRLCLIHAHLKLNIPISLLKYHNVAFNYFSEEFALIMEYLNPLLQRSRFTEESNEFRKPFSSDCQQFEKLLDSVLHKYNDEIEKLIADWEEVKRSRERAMTTRNIQLFKKKIANTPSFIINCESGKAYSLWNSALAAALSTLDILETSIQTNSFGNPNNTFEKQIYGNMSFIELENVLKLLKPLSQIVHFKTLTGTEYREVVEYFTEFFDAGSIDVLTFPDYRPESFCFMSLLKLVRKVRPSYVTYKRLGTGTEEEDLLAHEYKICWLTK